LDSKLLTSRLTGINNQIFEFIDQTEEVYGAIYAKLPEIETEIELNAEEMEILLNYFVYNEEIDDLSREEITKKEDDAYRLAQLLREMRDEFSKSILNMFDEKKLRKTIQGFLATEANDEIHGLDQLMKIIVEIKEHITVIEVVSMNAIIHSTKLGVRGKAFGVISENIKEFSNQIKGQYNLIFTHSVNLASWKGDFTEKLNHMLSYSDHLANVKVGEFNELFHDVFESLKIVSQLLKEANQSLELAIQPVQALMMAIQSQDLIKQSLESVTKCLSSTFDGIDRYDAKNENGHENQLDFLTFVEKALDLSIRLLMSIQDQVQTSVKKVEEPILTIKASLDETYEENSLLGEFLSGEQGDENNTIEEIFIKVKTFIKEFKEESVVLKTDLTSFNEVGAYFNKEMGDIEQQFIFIKNKVGYLQRLNILSRIELARLDGEVGAFGNEIERISERVINDVNNNEEFVIDLKKRLSKELNQFFKMLETNEKMADAMLNTAAQSLENLDMIELLVLQAVQPASETGKKLIKEIQYLTKQINEGKELPIRLQLITNELIELAEAIQSEKELTLQRAGLTEWTTTDSSLNEIIEQLTTYYDRVAASDVLEDDNYDIGDEGGELTLF
jgi:hypothetical protein